MTEPAQLTFSLGRFFGQDVILERAAMLIAVRGASETLRRAAIGFQFRHFKILRIAGHAIRAFARIAP